MDKEILSISDLATTLGMSAEEVQGLFKSGELPGRQIGAHWFCTRQQVLQYIESGEVSTATKGTSTSKELGGKHKADNSWECTSCQHKNGPEYVACSACGEITFPSPSPCRPADCIQFRVSLRRVFSRKRPFLRRYPAAPNHRFSLPYSSPSLSPTPPSFSISPA
jgi:hypothetical protein